MDNPSETGSLLGWGEFPEGFPGVSLEIVSGVSLGNSRRVSGAGFLGATLGLAVLSVAPLTTLGLSGASVGVVWVVLSSVMPRKLSSRLSGCHP